MWRASMLKACTHTAGPLHSELNHSPSSAHICCRCHLCHTWQAVSHVPILPTLLPKYILKRSPALQFLAQRLSYTSAFTT